MHSLCHSHKLLTNRAQRLFLLLLYLHLRFLISFQWTLCAFLSVLWWPAPSILFYLFLHKLILQVSIEDTLLLFTASIKDIVHFPWIVWLLLCHPSGMIPQVHDFFFTPDLVLSHPGQDRLGIDPSLDVLYWRDFCCDA